MTSKMERPRMMIAAVAFGVVAISPFTIMPMMVGALVSDIGLTLSQAGYVAAAEMAGSGLAAFVTSLFIARLNRRYTAASSLLLFIGSNLIAAQIMALDLLLFARFLAGVGSGITVAIVSAILAGTKAPERSFSLLFIGNLVFGMIAFLLLPSLILMPWGLSGVYNFLATLSILVLLLLPGLPLLGSNVVDHAEVKKFTVTPAMVLALTGMWLYFTAIGALWPFMEQLGVIRDISQNIIGFVLSSAQVSGICGAMLAAWLTTRLGHCRPIAAGGLLSLAAMASFLFGTQLWSYAFASVLFFFSYIFTLAYLAGVLAALDPVGRIAAFGVTMQTAGLAMGPAIAGEMFVRGGQASLIWFAAIFMLISLSIMISAARSVNK